MIKRAKRIALDFIKDITKPKEQQHTKKSKNKGHNHEVEGEGPITSDAETDKKLRNSTSEKHLSPSSPKHKRSSSKRKGRPAANSLPLPLNSDPSWQVLRERSITDPNNNSATLIKRKSKPNRAKSELSISSSRDKITEDESLTRGKSILKNKSEQADSSQSNEKKKEPQELASGSKIKQLDNLQVSFSVIDSAALDAQYVADRLAAPIAHDIIAQYKKEKKGKEEKHGSVKEVKPSRRDRGKSDWSAASFVTKGELVVREDSFARHNNEIMAIWDTMMDKEIEQKCAEYEDQKRDLLEEIRLREGSAQLAIACPPTPTQAQVPTQVQLSVSLGVPRRGNHARRGSTVVFQDTVEIREVGLDGTTHNTLTAALVDQAKPRPSSQKMLRKPFPHKPSPLSISLDSGVPMPSLSSPIPSPKNSPTSSPPASPVASPRRSPLPFFASSSPPPPFLSPIHPLSQTSINSPPSPVRSPPQSPFSSPLSSPTTSPATSPTASPSGSPNSSPTTPRKAHARDTPPKSKPLRAWAKVFSSRASKSKTQQGEIVWNAMDEEIAQATARYEREKLELLEEIEAREIRAATLRMEVERSELLAEIARREAQGEKESPRSGTPRERRHAMRLRKTLAQRLANGIDPQEILETNALNNTQKLKIVDETVVVKRPTRSVRKKDSVLEKNASLRHNARRKNLWLAEVPQAQVKAQTPRTHAQVGH